MFDIEELKKVISSFNGDDATPVMKDLCNAFELLIARCENAEKDRDEFKELLDMHRMSKDAAWCKVTGELLNIEDFKELVFKINSEKLALESELKELREQKPVAEDLLKRAFSLGEQAGIYGESDQPGLYNRAKKYEEDFKKLLDSVAQSRDSAELIGCYIEQPRESLLDILHQSNANAHSVKVPENANEAAAMQMIGYAWLEQNAPERLKQSPVVAVPDQPEFWAYVCNQIPEKFCIWRDKAPAGPVDGWTEYPLFKGRPTRSSKALNRDHFEDMQRVYGAQDCDLTIEHGHYTFEPIQKQWEFFMLGQQLSAAPQASAEHKCDACGGHDVELLKTCHNSLCENYSTHIGIYKGWENKSAQDEVKE